MKKSGMFLVSLMCVFLMGVSVYAVPVITSTQVIDLGDETIENVQIGYSNNPFLENLEYWFGQNGITNEDGSAIDPVADQLQYELFWTEVDKEYEVEFLGIGYAAYHSPFGVFTYNDNPYETFNSSALTFYEPLFVQNEVPKNSSYTFSIEGGSYFGFYLDSNKTGKNITTMVASNPLPTSNRVQDKSQYTIGYDHALFFETNKGYTIAFEDIIGGGDADHEDLVVNFKPTDGSGFQPTPEPATILLFGAGIAGLAGIGRKRFHKK